MRLGRRERALTMSRAHDSHCGVLPGCRMRQVIARLSRALCIVATSLPMYGCKRVAEPANNNKGPALVTNAGGPLRQTKPTGELVRNVVEARRAVGSRVELVARAINPPKGPALLEDEQGAQLPVIGLTPNRWPESAANRRVRVLGTVSTHRPRLDAGGVPVDESGHWVQAFSGDEPVVILSVERWRVIPSEEKP